MATAFENSASFFQAFADGVREVGLWDQLLAAVEPDVAAVLKAPRAQAWWPGAVLIRTVVAVERISDAAMVQRLGYLSVKNGVAPIAMPLVKVTFAVFGPSPHTIFNRAASYAPTAVRGLELAWAKDGERSGVLSATYPVAVPAQYAAIWKGTLDFVFELTKVKGVFGELRHELDGRQLLIPVSWS